MTKKPHPSEALDAANIARAKYFTAFIRHSPTETVRIQCGTQAEAFEQANKLDKTNKFGRRACVYAVTPEDWSIPVKRPARQIQPRR